MAGGCSHKVLFSIVFRRYAQTQKGFVDQKTNIRCKNLYYLLTQAYWRQTSFQWDVAQCCHFKIYRSLPCDVIDSWSMTCECHVGCYRTTSGLRISSYWGHSFLTFWKNVFFLRDIPQSSGLERIRLGQVQSRICQSDSVNWQWTPSVLCLVKQSNPVVSWPLNQASHLSKVKFKQPTLRRLVTYQPKSQL